MPDLTPVLRPLGRFAHVRARHDPPVPPWLMRPFTDSRRWTMTHYNVVIPDLPEPHRFLACMTIVGQSGVKMLDVDDAVTTTPRDTVTLTCATAATAPATFTTFSARRDCEFAPDSSRIRLAESLEITGRFPDYHVEIRQPRFSASLDLRCTGQITWWGRSPVYDHVGLPARYEGTLTHDGTGTPIAGMCSLEQMRAGVPLVVGSRARSPRRVKWPADFFTYQVLDLGDGELLTFAQVMILGVPLVTGAYWTRLDGDKHRYVDDVTLTVRRLADEPARSPAGEAMPVPRELTWTVGGGRDLEVTLTVDTGWVYGVGRGHLAGASYAGTVRGRDVQGRAYVEWIDCRRRRR